MKTDTATVTNFASAVLSLAQERDNAIKDAEWHRTHSIRPHGRKKSKRPSPRIEFEYIQDPDWHRHTCLYWLVIPLGELDVRREKNDKKPFREWYIPVGSTTVTSSSGLPPIYNGAVSTPFRDGAHAQFDREALGLPSLPIWAVCGDTATLISKTENQKP